MIKKYLYLIVIFVVTLGSDIITKYLVINNFNLGESKTIIPDFFNITYILNPGAIFGFLSTMNDTYRRIFFIVVSLIVIVAITYMIIKEKNKLSKISLVLILAGAFGNLIDRITVGSVIDFLDFELFGRHWYTFNIADSCITVGISLMILDILLNRRTHNV